MWVESAPQTLRNIEHKVYPLKQTVKEMTHAADQVDQMTTVTTTDAVAIKSVSFREVLYENARSLVTGIIMTSLSLYFALSWGPVLVVRVKQLLRDPEKRKGFTELSMVLEQEVSSYLFTIAIINCGLGAAVAAVLYLFDVPHPVILGVVAMVLNFIPYLGALATFLVITATTLLSFDSLEMPALVGTVFLILTIAEGQIITPLILGRRLALNPLMVFVSIAFWFWLWGVMGALMAVPILIILKLVGDRVDIMRPIAALLAR
jgi:predicted PurR-regulated permease PerM